VLVAEKGNQQPETCAETEWGLGTAPGGCRGGGTGRGLDPLGTQHLLGAVEHQLECGEGCDCKSGVSGRSSVFGEFATSGHAVVVHHERPGSVRHLAPAVHGEQGPGAEAAAAGVVGALVQQDRLGACRNAETLFFVQFRSLPIPAGDTSAMVTSPRRPVVLSVTAATTCSSCASPAHWSRATVTLCSLNAPGPTALPRNDFGGTASRKQRLTRGRWRAGGR